MTGFACMVPLCRADRGPTSPQWGNTSPAVTSSAAEPRVVRRGAGRDGRRAGRVGDAVGETAGDRAALLFAEADRCGAHAAGEQPAEVGGVVVADAAGDGGHRQFGADQAAPLSRSVYATMRGNSGSTRTSSRFDRKVRSVRSVARADAVSRACAVPPPAPMAVPIPASVVVTTTALRPGRHPSGRPSSVWVNARLLPRWWEQCSTLGRRRGGRPWTSAPGCWTRGLLMDLRGADQRCLPGISPPRRRAASCSAAVAPARCWPPQCRARPRCWPIPRGQWAR
ncbi:polyketide synthase [Streptomyces rapamycinicus NRRL 5491]|uniref:Polyketide synthase n=1 Tax=Streptomyces rapamycinicus (strain ATCC 29253 / DSM 41530 / NRRL 5491 / AYB-994) TaxID=1343740 RepID=A0A3L8RB64_STRRN|nr:polyketide synthase [Streptomyces rapamycinicus NRRL 5491]